MTKMVRWFRKGLLLVGVLVLGLAALPVRSAFADGLSEPPDPGQPGQITTDRLELIWARERAMYDRMGKLFDNSESMLQKAQKLIDDAKARGKDVSAVQSALDALTEALRQAKPVYESGKGILASHKGFDDSGKVTDAELAKQTVKDLGAKLKQVHQLIDGPAKALREAIRAFREANKLTPTPSHN